MASRGLGQRVAALSEDERGRGHGVPSAPARGAGSSLSAAAAAAAREGRPILNHTNIASGGPRGSQVAGTAASASHFSE
jgi:hypothetical protein